MFENVINFFKNMGKKQEKNKNQENSKNTAKERLHLVLMQDRANVSVDFLELMKQEIIEVIKKYIDVDEKEIDVRLTNQENDDGTNGAPALYANIPILNIKNEARKLDKNENNGQNKEKKQNSEEEKNEKAEIEKKENDLEKKESQEIIEENNKKEDKIQGENLETEGTCENKLQEVIEIIKENQAKEKQKEIEEKKIKEKVKSEE